MGQPSWFRTALLFGLLIAVAILAFGVIGRLPAQNAPVGDKPFVVEYYYKAQWGPADEWLALFKKNHLPVLKALKEQGRPFGRQAAMAKLYSSETAMWTTTKSVQIHGGYGYSTEYEIERLYREAGMLLIGEGTSDIQKMIIGRRILEDYRLR